MQISELLVQADIDQLDAEVLLAYCLQKDRAWLMAHPDEDLSEEQIEQWSELHDRRKSSEPVAYIIGEKEFYGRRFIVTPDVLIPRPATEHLIDHAISFLQHPANEVHEADTDVVTASLILKDLGPVQTIVDIGTGCGCIGVTLAAELPHVRVICCDVSKDALEVAKQNIIRQRMQDRITVAEGDCLDPVQDLTEPFLVVSNPPYIPNTEELMGDVMDYEPHLALFGGIDGGSVVEKIVQQAKQHPMCVGVVMECKTEQAKHSVSE